MCLVASSMCRRSRFVAQGLNPRRSRHEEYLGPLKLNHPASILHGLLRTPPPTCTTLRHSRCRRRPGPLHASPAFVVSKLEFPILENTLCTHLARQLAVTGVGGSAFPCLSKHCLRVPLVGPWCEEGNNVVAAGGGGELVVCADACAMVRGDGTAVVWKFVQYWRMTVTQINLLSMCMAPIFTVR